jgi:translocation and assembly module TamB
VAKALCVVFAAIGILPIAATVLARSSLLNGWAASQSSALLAAQGLRASYAIEVSLWPLELELTSVRIDSTDGGKPALTSDRIAARPRIFPLLSGKLAIDQIEIDQPTVRVWIQDGKLMNLPIDIQKKDSGESKPFHAPFSVFAVTGAEIDVTVDDMHAVADEVDLDVTVDDESARGSSFEIASRIGKATFHRSRIVYLPGDDTPELAVDDDALCGLEARVRYEPGTILVRRLTAAGSADLDVALKSTPRCDLAPDDKRRVEVDLSHVRIQLPDKTAKTGALPRVDGHLRVRAPLGLVERAVSVPETDGWLGIDGDVRYSDQSILPEVTAHFEAHDLKLEKYRFAQEIQSDLVVHENIVTSPKTVVRIADGVATLTDVEVRPLEKGIPLRTRLDVSKVSFFGLMRDLGISPHPHVWWDIDELHVPSFKGTLDPLRLDADFTGKTSNFSVSDIAQDDPAHVRLIGFKEATLAAHVAVRPSALEFQNVRSQLERSFIEGGFVSIGFDNVLKVDVAHVHADLKDITPLADIPLSGVADAEAHVSGLFSDPRLEADATIQDFVLGAIPFGNVTAAHVSLEGETVTLRNVKAQKNKSLYEMPTGKLEFGGKASMEMDAVATSNAFGLRDFFNLFQLDEDPRFDGLDASIATRAKLRIVMGGPEDVCGGGLIDVNATAHVKDVTLLTEHFDDGDLDLEFRWADRQGGIPGADIDVRGFTLHKFHPAGKEPTGSVLGSAKIQRGGAINGSFVMEGIPLFRVQSLGAVRTSLEGSVAGVAEVAGTIDSFRVDGDVDVTPVRIRGVPFGSSHLHLAMTQVSAPQKPLGKTRCGNPIYPLFDKEAYLHDTSSAGDYMVDGDLFAGQVHLDGVKMTRQKSPLLLGKVGFRKLDLGALVKAVSPPPGADDVADPSLDVHGELTGDLDVTRLVLDDLPHAAIRFAPASLFVERSGQRITLRPTREVLTLASDNLVVPPLIFDLQAPRGLKGTFTLSGSVARPTYDPQLALGADLSPVDLGIMVGVVPKVDRALGTLSASVRLTGKARAPEIDGVMRVRGGELAIKGIPGVISDVQIDVRADQAEIQITRATARFGGGTLQATGTLPIRGFVFGQADAQVTARGIHLAPSEGVAATVDADLTIDLNPRGDEGPTAQLPHITGDVVVTQFEYTRPINLATDLSAFGVRAKRTVVETYDPSLDALTLDLRVRARSPFRIRNNLVEVSLGIDSGALNVTGTNQRIGLRGDLKTLPGGRFHLRGNEFDIRQGYIRFDDPTRIAPNVDVLAVTEYRRYTDTSSGAGAASGAASAIGGTSRGGALWRISLHAYGDADDLRLDMTSDPPLSQEDIVLLLTIGMTRAEIDQLQAGSLGASAALEALATVSGADRAVKSAIPVIDDFRFGSAYSSRTGRTEPQVTIGKRLTEDVRASVTTGLTGDQDREFRANIEWRLNQRVSVQSSYDNINDVTSSTVGNVGVDLRWRLEFE